ncbi:MAG: ATP-dependent helicase [Blastocatellia bacterium AA13]|nr:MAG: ATP-dependent helicase [Blastocatellia bacterium AA13]
MSFAPGTLVKARGREWVVLPESEDDFLVVRPLGGTLQETAGIHSGLETVEPATFQPPGKNDLGDFVSCRLLRDAVRFGFRSSAGPFRSFGRLAVQPRPYQLVPLLMALKLDPMRMLIADDVGIGKTVEACLVAREMLDRGEITRLCVLCPPHLAEQWQRELSSKFNIDAELVLSSTARRLEKNLRADQSIFDANPFVVVSMDFIKSDRRRHDFLRTCPDFVIVDEAHTCAASAVGRGSSHQRHELLAKLAEKVDRHLVLVTATPHSGNEGAFRSLLTLLTPEFGNLPDDLSGPDKVPFRRRLAAHLVQRRRFDLRHFLQRNTPFPDRKDTETHYELSPAYKALFEKVLDYARETVSDTSGGVLRQRVRWWSALSLLRAMASSPAAAAATLTERSNVLEADDEKAADELGRKSVLDATDDLGDETSDVMPGADPEPEGDNPVRRRLLAFAREAKRLCGDEDHKLTELLPRLKALLSDGYKPIIFCRFIRTAEYVAAELRDRLRKVEVTCITSQLAPEERAARIETLGSDSAAPRILVCTDCLSEGINLQEKFDAVVHYDLSWNPTRHEQRDGRVDRFGQPRKEIRILTYYGTDNQIDGIVLDVLLRKHQKIRNALGVSVPMPVDSEQIIKAVFEGLLLRGKAETLSAQLLPGFEEYFRPQKQQLHDQWEAVADREKRLRKTMFAQESIKFEEVANELAEAERAIGSPEELATFFRSTLTLSGAVVNDDAVLKTDLAGIKPAVREALGEAASLKVAFEPVSTKDVTLLHRTHPLVEGLATYVLNAALDPLLGGIARRAGVVRSKAITTRTVLMLLRLRFHIVTTTREGDRNLLAEDALLAAFTADPASPQWLPETEAEKLVAVKPDANVPPDIAIQQLESITDHLPELDLALNEVARARGQQLFEAHRRVRSAARARGSYRIEHSPPDVLGLYIFLPVVKLA